MTISHRVELTGAPGSPYTRKMLGALRYRRIPFQVYWGQDQVPDGYPAPKVRLLPTFYFQDGEDGALVPVTDSTPILRRFETEHSGRSLIPPHPVLRLLNELVEDYGDEWLTKAMFHFRWAHQADAENAAPLLVYWSNNTAPADAAKQFADHFANRQIERLYVVGSNDVTAQTIESSYERLLRILDDLITQGGFIFGRRPSSADFALFGQLTQLAVVEPTSAAITSQTSQRVRAWVDLMEDLSGLEASDDDWFDLDTASRVLGPLLSEIGRTYAPAMLANASAVASGDASFETTIDGRAWTQPVFKYQAKCLGWLQDHYRALSDDDRETVNTLLSGTGCEPLFS